MSCKYASSGCDYPAGECAGLCGHKKPKPLMLARELEGVYPVSIQDQEAAAAELRRGFQSEIEGWRHAAELDDERSRLIYELASVQAQRQAAHRSIEMLQDELVRVAVIHDEMLTALKQCDEAMSYMSEYDIPITLPATVKSAIAKAEGN